MGISGHRRPQLQGLDGNKILRQRNVEERVRILSDHPVFAICGDTDNLYALCGRSEELQGEALAGGILVRPELVGHGLVHDRDKRSVLVVQAGEGPAPQKRNSHGFEITWVDVVEEYSGSLLIGGDRTTFDGNGAGIGDVQVPQWSPKRQTDRLDARKRAHTGFQPAIEFTLLLFVVAHLVRVHRNVQHMIGLETELDATGVLETTHEEAGDH
jgi:hypothetical protein